ncbi:MAG: hypothetical protein RLZZ303_2926 [Candidatus Hydrogenedentota bacterium]|jgi:HPt (histidine-containing phosphotransfer) domain-containing protein
MSDSTPAPVDLVRLKEVSMGDPGFERVLLEAYLEESMALCGAIQEAIKAVDGNALSSAAHSLKGSSANVGAEEVRRIATVLERVELHADPGAAAILSMNLRAQLERVKVFVAGYQPA